MIDFDAEKSSQHYRGRFAGFGPIRDSEVIYLAVFESTQRTGSQLSAKSFDENNLKAGTLSVARGSFVTRQVFQKQVVQRGIPTKGDFVGLSTAEVAKIREIRADVTTSANTVVKVRGFCVIDLVEEGDFSAHAVFGYGRHAQAISQKNISKLRATLLLDLKWVFSNVIQIESLRWPSPNRDLLRRLIALLRTVLTTPHMNT